MYIMDRIYEVLGVNENKNLYNKLIINYTCFIVLFIIVGILVKYTTTMPKRVNETSKILLSPTRRERIVQKIRNSPIRIQTKKHLKLSDNLL